MSTSWGWETVFYRQDASGEPRAEPLVGLSQLCFAWGILGAHPRPLATALGQDFGVSRLPIFCALPLACRRISTPTPRLSWQRGRRPAGAQEVALLLQKEKRKPPLAGGESGGTRSEAAASVVAEAVTTRCRPGSQLPEQLVAPKPIASTPTHHPPPTPTHPRSQRRLHAL